MMQCTQVVSSCACMAVCSPQQSDPFFEQLIASHQRFVSAWNYFWCTINFELSTQKLIAWTATDQTRVTSNLHTQRPACMQLNCLWMMTNQQKIPICSECVQTPFLISTVIDRLFSVTRSLSACISRATSIVLPLLYCFSKLSSVSQWVTSRESTEKK